MMKLINKDKDRTFITFFICLSLFLLLTINFIIHFTNRVSLASVPMEQTTTNTSCKPDGCHLGHYVVEAVSTK